MMNCDVYADNDTNYLQLSDYYLINAYKYWELYGFSADSSTQYTQTYTTSGTTSFNADLALTYNISESGDADFAGQPLLEWHDSDGGYSIWIPKSLDMTISPDTGQTGSQTVPKFSCVYNPSATGASATMTCTPSGNSVFTQDTYTLELNTIGNDGSNGLFAYVRPSDLGQGTGSVTISDSHPLSADFVINGSASSSGNIVGSGTVSLTTTTVNTSSVKLGLPILKANSIDNSWPPFPDGHYMNTSPKAGKAVRNNINDPVTFIFLFNESQNVTLNNMIALFDANHHTNGQRVNYTHKNITNMTMLSNGMAGMFLWAFSVSTPDIPTNTFFTINWNLAQEVEHPEFQIVPLFVGAYSRIPDDLFRFVYGRDRTLEEVAAFHNDMVSGNTQSQSAANGMNQVEQDFVGKTDELIDFEGDTFNSMDSAIDGVQLDNNLISGSGFLNAANWVRVQFDNLISYSPLSSVLVFSLSLGFALLIIGKVR